MWVWGVELHLWILSWRFSQSRPDHLCPTSQSSYLWQSDQLVVFKIQIIWINKNKEFQYALKWSWILLRMFMLCLLSTMLTARPLLPNRPVRPILCKYVSLSGFPSLSTGRSKFITTDTCSTSIPVNKRHSVRLSPFKENNHNNLGHNALATFSEHLLRRGAILASTLSAAYLQQSYWYLSKKKNWSFWGKNRLPFHSSSG